MQLLKYIFLLIFLCPLTGLLAQNLPEQNCNGAISVCQPVYTQANSYVGVGSQDELNGANQDCLGLGENNTAWYIMNVTSPGTLVFDITPNSANDDYDFAVWNGTGVGCGAVAAGPPIRCNYAANGSSSPGGLTGLSTGTTATSLGAAGPSYSAAINALAGETYILVVDNFSSSQFGYTLNFGNSTASIFDTIKPHMVSAGSHCGFISDELKLTMSEAVQCSSISPNGSDFYITPAVPGTTITSATSVDCQAGGQFTAAIDLQFSSVLPAGTYWLHVQNGSDGNTVQDNCGNFDLLTDSIAFTMTTAAPPQVISLDTPACLFARIRLDRNIVCGSVAPDGSDFQVTGPGNVQVVSATPFGCDALGMTDTIDITFDQSVITPGIYTLHVKPGNDGNSLVDTCGLATNNSITWTVSDHGVNATASSNLVCDPGYVQLSATTTLPASPNGYQLVWTPGNLTTDSTSAVTQAYINQDIVYHVQIMDSNFCYRRDTAGILISIRNPGLTPMPEATICAGKQVLLEASGGLTYTWYPSDSLSCTDCPNPIASPDQTTSYSVIIADSYNCADTLATQVTVFPLPIAYAGNDTTIFYGNVGSPGTELEFAL